MSRQFIDLSIYLENDVITDPPFMRPEITYQTHEETVPEANHFFQVWQQMSFLVVTGLLRLKL
ncbi:hypothetical protein AB8616_00725 [Marinomonas sp. RS-M-Aa-14]|uniref:hypothetical protein n=1 Tax=Marinomonas sp. RS-M-Aa-14 TaxID=3241169 RepID=UPI003AAAD3B5